MSWKTIDDTPIKSIHRWVYDAARNGRIVHIGTDSLQTGRYTQFVTVVVILNPPKGGRVAYLREIVPRIDSLRERLNKEVWKSVALASELELEQLPTIHIDANPSEKFMSNKYLQELVGLVVGQGFKAVWKPDSWAATHAADHIVRLNEIKRSRGERAKDTSRKRTRDRRAGV